MAMSQHASVPTPGSVDDLDLDQADDLVEDAHRLRWRATGDGHCYVTDHGPHSGREYPHYLHRLTAYAWGVLDRYADPRHVHHDIPDEWLADRDTRDAGIPWLDVEDCLTALWPDEHADEHLLNRPKNVAAADLEDSQQ